MGMPVTVFFPFWGLLVLKHRTRFQGKGLLGILLTAMQPSRPEKLGLSKWNMLGLGRRLFGVAMRKNGMETLQRRIHLAREMDGATDCVSNLHGSFGDFSGRTPGGRRGRRCGHFS